MRLLVGLGNPGEQYVATRHNIGFLFLDYLAQRHGISLKNESKWEAEAGRGSLWGEPVFLLKPQTYMNRSGQAAGKVARFYRLAPEDLVVFHDEIDLPFGTARVARGRGAGGHNGVRSLMDHLGSRDFLRFRIGVGRPPGERAAAGYVLAPFSVEERQGFSDIFSLLEEGLKLLLTRDDKAAMNLINASTSGKSQPSQAGSGEPV